MLGLVNLLIYIASVPGVTLSFQTVVAGLISGPLLCCVWGLIGIGIDSIRGRKAEYPGWYWWVFPIVTFLFVGLWFGFGLLGIFLAFAGIKLPNLPDFGYTPKSSNIDRDKLRQKLENMKAEDLLKEFGDKLEQLDNQDRLNPEEKRVIKKIRGLDRAKLRSLVQHTLTKEEIEIFFVLILKLLSGELS